MALLPRKKTRTVKKEPLKKAQGSTSVKKTAAKPVAVTLKRVPVTKRSRPVLSQKKFLAPASEIVIMPPKVEVKAPQEVARELPENYGDNQIYLIVRDPYWVYAYWGGTG